MYLWNDLVDTWQELEKRYPYGFPYTRNDVRLGIAALEDETMEVYTEWNNNKHHLGNCIHDIRIELLQVAAIAMMMIAGIDKADNDVQA